MTKIEIDGFEAVLKDGQWMCEKNETLAKVLDAMSSYALSLELGYIPDVRVFLANWLAARFGGRVVETDKDVLDPNLIY